MQATVSYRKHWPCSSALVAMHTMVLQNRMALDILLASKAGTCAGVGQECRTDIPDPSARVDEAVATIRKEVAVAKRDQE
jgi:hypothetical protein